MMAQHDYLLDNALGIDFRADINNALLAIATSNSGTVAPVTPKPGMLWFDTLATPGTFRLRNAQETDWLAVAVGAGFLPLAGGTISGNLAVAGLCSNFDFNGMRVSYAGLTAPTSPAGGQLWYDTNTTAGKLKIRNFANTEWLDVVDLTSPDLFDQMAIMSTAGNAQLNLVASGERRRILGNQAGQRFDFYGPADQPTLYIADTGDIYIPAIGNWVTSYMANLQPNLGYTPVKQYDGNVISIGGDPPRIWINGADQGVIALGDGSGFLAHNGVGSYAIMRSSIAATVDALIAGSSLTFYPSTEVATGTWRVMNYRVLASGVALMQKVS